MSRASLAIALALVGCSAAGSATRTVATEKSAVVRLVDTADSLIDKEGRPTMAEPFLDLLEADLAEADGAFVLRLRVTAPLPDRTPDPQFFYEWDIQIVRTLDANGGDLREAVQDVLGNPCPGWTMTSGHGSDITIRRSLDPARTALSA